MEMQCIGSSPRLSGDRKENQERIVSDAANDAVLCGNCSADITHTTSSGDSFHAEQNSPSSAPSGADDERQETVLGSEPNPRDGVNRPNVEADDDDSAFARDTPYRSTRNPFAEALIETSRLAHSIDSNYYSSHMIARKRCAPNSNMKFLRPMNNVTQEKDADQDSLESNKQPDDVLFYLNDTNKPKTPNGSNVATTVFLPLDMAFRAKYVFLQKRARTAQDRVYIFLEHPTGCIGFLYHFVV